MVVVGVVVVVDVLVFMDVMVGVVVVNTVAVCSDFPICFHERRVALGGDGRGSEGGVVGGGCGGDGGWSVSCRCGGCDDYDDDEILCI